jgi:hypothetical protein
MLFLADREAGFANAQVRVASAAVLQTASPVIPWESPTKIFCQISPKRSSETRQGLIHLVDQALT